MVVLHRTQFLHLWQQQHALPARGQASTAADLRVPTVRISGGHRGLVYLSEPVVCHSSGVATHLRMHAVAP